MELHHVDTEDGWRLRLFRFPGDKPVLFVHGMGANHHNFDLNERHSLARHVARAGYDCWVVELRGRGESQELEGKGDDWDFEDFLNQDLKACLALIAQHNPGPVHWVGHSMGGMLGLAMAASEMADSLRSLTLFGTPLGFSGQWMLKAWGAMAQVHRVLPTMDQEKWGRRMLPLVRRNRKAVDFFLRFLANPDNVDEETSLDIFEKLVTNEAPGIILQFSDWVRFGHVRSRNKQVDYTEALDRVRTPALFISGVQDRMSPPSNTRRWMKRLASKEKRLIELSVKTGFSADYGHGDLLVGKRAPEEVYPLAVKWLREVDEQLKIS